MIGQFGEPGCVREDLNVLCLVLRFLNKAVEVCFYMFSCHLTVHQEFHFKDSERKIKVVTSFLYTHIKNAYKYVQIFYKKC